MEPLAKSVGSTRSIPSCLCNVCWLVEILIQRERTWVVCVHTRFTKQGACNSIALKQTDTT